MPMDKTIASLNLIQGKISDFKLELGRVSDAFKVAVDAYLKSETSKKSVQRDPYFFDLFSNPRKFLEQLFKANNFSMGLEKLNGYIRDGKVDPSLAITLFGDESIKEALSNFVTEYGVYNFYNNDKTKILQDLDSVIIDANIGSQDVSMQPEQKESVEIPAISEPEILTPAPKDTKQEESIVPGVGILEKPEGKKGTTGAGAPRQVSRTNFDLKLTPQGVLAYQLNYSADFFKRDDEPLKEQFKKMQELKKELKEDLSIYNFYSPFSSLTNQDMILYIDETVSPPTINMDESVFLQFHNLVLDKIARLKQLLQTVYSASATSVDLGGDKESVKTDLAKAEAARYQYSKELDDLLAACKLRDHAIYDKFNLLKTELRASADLAVNLASLDSIRIEKILISNSLRNPQTLLGSALMDLTNLICFYVSLHSEATIEKMNWKSKDQKANESLTASAFASFTQGLRTQLTSKISRYFDYARNESMQDFYCSYISSSIKTELLYTTAYNSSVRAVRTGWNYIACPTCNKNIYYSKYKEKHSDQLLSELPGHISEQTGMTIEQATMYLDAAELSDYAEERYSFFKNDGSLITTRELDEQATREGTTWGNILKSISSNNLAEHREGIKLRQSLLKSLGARTIDYRRGSNATAVWAYKTKCPFSGTDLPESLRIHKEKAAGEGKELYIRDFSCGISLDVSQIISSGRKIEPYELQGGPSIMGMDPHEHLNSTLDTAIQSGIIAESDRQSFIDELSRRRSGGWKFSKIMFNCPCKPDISLDTSKDVLRRSEYIASPISGFVTADNIKNGIIHPPSSSSGEVLQIEDGTASYIICGKTTSISSFCRDTSDPGSLYGIIEKNLNSSLSGDESAKKYLINIIDTLLFLGVDFNDILPFIDRMYTASVGRTISASHRGVISKILKNAIDLQGSAHDRSSNLSRIDVLGDLKLVCSNGHKFTIKDSVRFGQTHTAHSISKNEQDLNRIANNSALYNSGYQNLASTLKLEIPGLPDVAILSLVNEHDIPIGKKKFTDWNGKWNSKTGLSEYYYVDPNGNYYVFNKPKTYVAWGDYNSAQSVEPYTSVDKTTLLTVHNTSKETTDTEDVQGSGGESKTVNKTDAHALSMYNQSQTQDFITFENMGNKLAALDIAYSPLAVMLQSTLKMIEDYCNMASTLSVSAPLRGNPIRIGKNEEEILGIVKGIFEKLYEKAVILNLRGNVNKDERTRRAYEAAMAQSAETVSNAMDLFNSNYFDIVKKQDLRLLSMTSPSVSLISKNRIRTSIVNAISAAMAIEEDEDEQNFYRYEIFDMQNQTTRMHDKDMQNNLDRLFESVSGQVDKIIEIIQSKVGSPKKTELSGLVSNESSLGVSNMKGQELVGRVMMLSSALSLADSLSVIYLRYLDKNGEKYIGVDIGLDLSSPNNIINFNQENGAIFALSEADIGSIPVRFPLDQFADHYDGLDDLDPEEYDPEDDSSDLPELYAHFMREYMDEVRSCIAALSDEILKTKSACTNSLYTTRAIELINKSLVAKINNHQFSDDFSKKLAVSLIENCIVTPPMTTLSLAPGDKYHGYFAGTSDNLPSGSPFRILPVFMASTAKMPQAKPGSAPIFILSGSDANSATNLGIGGFTAPIKKKVVLYKGENSNIESFSGSLPKEVTDAGWKLGLVSDSIKSSFDSVSLFYHPFTLAVKSDGKQHEPDFDKTEIVGFVNSFTGFNSTTGFSVGPISDRSGAQLVYPPIYDYDSGASHAGMFLPLDYGDTKDVSQSNIKTPPFFDANIPVTLPTEAAGESVTIDISDFLMRDPPDVAVKILQTITDYYVDFLKKSKLMQQNVNTPAGMKKYNEMKTSYKMVIARLWSQYRGLPYKVANTRSSTHIEYHGLTGEKSAVPSRSMYIPFADYVTCNKILESPEYSPEFGGHSLWDENDSAKRSKIIGAVKQMLVKMNNLDQLATIFASKVEPGFEIEAEHLLDPHGQLFKVLQKKAMDRLDSENRQTPPSSVDYAVATSDLVKKVTLYSEYSIGEVEEGDLGTTAAEIARAEGRKDFFWKDRAYQTAMTKYNSLHRDWSAALGPMYPISVASVGANGEPMARIKVMNEIFPFNGGKETRVDSLKEVQDPNSKRIIGQDDFYMSKILSGALHSFDTYPVPTDPAKLKEHLDRLSEDSKKVTVSATRYAENIATMLVDHVITDLKNRIIIEKTGKDVQEDIKPISKKASLDNLKKAYVRVASTLYVDNLRRAGIAALWSTFNK